MAYEERSSTPKDAVLRMYRDGDFDADWQDKIKRTAEETASKAIWHEPQRRNSGTRRDSRRG